MVRPRYELLDAVEMHREHPDTFLIPSLRSRLQIRVGSFVKLGFLLPEPCDGFALERMWVKVAKKSGRRYHGALANTPCYFDDLRCGDDVEFSPKHVLDISKNGKPSGPPVVLLQQLLISKRLLEDDARPCEQGACRATLVMDT